jgi:hypothetical protein
VLTRRFDLFNWFKRHGYPDSLWQQPQQQQPVAPRKPTAVRAAAQSPHPSSPAAVKQSDLQVIIDDVVDPAAHAPLLVFDWDKTLSAFDAGGCC